MPVIDVRDTRLYYETAGTGRPTLLFIHGMCGGTWNWHDQMERLSPEFHCIAYDRRGHGRSEPGERDQRMSTHVDDAAALIEALGLDQPILVGSSAGGAISLEVMYRYPDLTRGATIVEPPLLNLVPDESREFRAALGPALEQAIEKDQPRDAVDGFFRIVCAQFWEQADESRRDLLRSNHPMLFAALQSEGATVTREQLATITRPTLLMSGTDSPSIMHAVVRILVDTLPNLRHTEFQDCGHVVYAERPEAFAKAVRAFVHEISAVTASAE